MEDNLLKVDRHHSMEQVDRHHSMEQVDMEVNNNNNKWVVNQEAMVNLKGDMLNNHLHNMVSNKIHMGDINSNLKGMETLTDNNKVLVAILTASLSKVSEVDNNRWEALEDRGSNLTVVIKMQGLITEVHLLQCHTDLQNNKIHHQM